jgi:hypothetical protein
MRTYLVVVAPPSLDDHLRLGARTKPLKAQTPGMPFGTQRNEVRAFAFFLPIGPSK